MTCIAFRAGVMAADSLVLLRDVDMGPHTKVFRGPDGSLLAAAGTSYACELLGKAHECGEKVPSEALKDASVSALVAKPDGRLYHITDTDPALEIHREWFAQGSGADYALGAMAVGATAEEAVAAAIACSNTCGGPITAMRLPDAGGGDHG